MKRINPFVEIYKQCNSSSNSAKYNALRNKENAVPLYLDIELTNCCNIQCNMCPVGTEIMQRKKGFMSEEIFEKVLENIKRYHIQGVRFIRWGEPTLHPQFLKWGKILKKEGVLVHFNTNGLLLDEETILEIVKLKIDSVKFSFQGIDDLTYREMRKGGSYSQLLAAIKMMHKIRGDEKEPYISVTTSITYESEEEIALFKREVYPYCDEIDVGRTKLQHVDIAHMELSDERRRIYEQFMKEDKRKIKHMTVCPEIWDKLSINWDGSVSACCQDYDNLMLSGNIMQNDLHEIFTGTKEMYYREILKNNNYDELLLCRNCYEYIPLKR